MAKRAWSEEQVATFLANVFPRARAGIGMPPNEFSWHKDASSPRSSQALAIDVFGTIRTHPAREAILCEIARELGVPDEGPWDVVPEWHDTRNTLKEIVPTQVDAAAVGVRAIILFEGKFTEPGGSCSQPNPGKTRLGAVRPADCSGSYEEQFVPSRKTTSRCALSAKGIRYWDYIPALYGIDAGSNHQPCPFRLSSYQWMRNSVLARALSEATGKRVVVVAAYADADFFLPTADKARKGGVFGEALLNPDDAIRSMSYQSIIGIAARGAPDAVWSELRDWVEAKIERQRGAA